MKNTAFYSTDILLPEGQDNTKWSVIACDQFTEQKQYWRQVEETVGDAPSTLKMILPEAYLDEPDADARIGDSAENMRRYLNDGILKTYQNALIYIERTLSDGTVRPGLVGALDLEEYSFSPDAATLCRPTEQTVAERIPPRQKIRKAASLELPHAMLLMDDKNGTVLEFLGANKQLLTPLYDFELMAGSGHLKGWLLPEDMIEKVQDALCTLRAQSEQKYGTPLLFLVGDGNHSIATAKTCYEQLKDTLGKAAENHPARYCLVEVCNLHHPSIRFEPIHRTLFGVDKATLLCALSKEQGSGAAEQSFILMDHNGQEEISLPHPTSKLTVGTLQQFLDRFMAQKGGITIDYVHEYSSLVDCCAKGGISLILPAMDKDKLFESILSDGVLPRKTFSMGHAADKRFYLECRKIVREGL